MGKVNETPSGVGVVQDLTQLAVKILYDGSTGCDEVDDYLATEGDIIIHTKSDCDVVFCLQVKH